MPAPAHTTALLPPPLHAVAPTNPPDEPVNKPVSMRRNGVRQAQLKIPPLTDSAAEAATRKQAEVTDR